MLAGDLLLTEAFEVVASADLSPAARVRAAKALSHGAGAYGMVYGQELDLYYEAHDPTEEQLRLVHRNKTGALINAAVQMGVAAADAARKTQTPWSSMPMIWALCFRLWTMCWM